MSEPTPAATAPAVTWRVRVVRRVAGSLGAAVVIAGVAPALANAAGADVTNPVAIALRASGRGIQSAFGTSSTDTVASCDPSASPVETTAAAVEPTVTPEATQAPVESVAPSESVEPSVEPSLVPSVEPSAEPSVEPSVEPVATTAAPGGDETPEPCESEEPTESESPEVTGSEDSDDSEESEEDGAHGTLVSTVAKCAPKGKDRLLDVEGAPANHGGYVRAAAHGDTLTTPWGAFDLSTQAGADALCAAVTAAREALPEETASAKQHGKPDKEHGKPTKDKAAKSHGKGAAKAGKGGGEADED